MPANRKDFVTVNGVAHEIVYLHDSNSVLLKAQGSEHTLEGVEGQYVLETPQRRDLVVNELLFLEERGHALTTADLIKLGFRSQ